MVRIGVQLHNEGLSGMGVSRFHAPHPDAVDPPSSGGLNEALRP